MPQQPAESRSAPRRAVQDQAVSRPSEVGQQWKPARSVENVFAAQGLSTWEDAEVGKARRAITQIYEGTNQIQRMVMARALLKG
ncbi:hypothetical protein Actkin_05549 [Actinokineospora sp. UTMC 2448]|nr:hypothetical protein Actkin_05549 [Actinokineospora sp. UTMC 2448]